MSKRAALEAVADAGTRGRPSGRRAKSDRPYSRGRFLRSAPHLAARHALESRVRRSEVAPQHSLLLTISVSCKLHRSSVSSPRCRRFTAPARAGPCSGGTFDGQIRPAFASVVHPWYPGLSGPARVPAGGVYRVPTDQAPAETVGGSGYGGELRGARRLRCLRGQKAAFVNRVSTGWRRREDRMLTTASSQLSFTNSVRRRRSSSRAVSARRMDLTVGRCPLARRACGISAWTRRRNRQLGPSNPAKSLRLFNTTYCQVSVP
jgi:hypothetical protein